ncbi:hypothetical protein ACFY3J_32355 [Streptomyces sp. NPDC001231]|uniref:hypothetical protein n=1 Tax=Streptomyces sp. NPDC001231 TaxID=3364549 RepID=UPI00369DCC23
MSDHYDSHGGAPADDAGRPDTENGMTRCQLMRRTGWFGDLVVLTVASGEVISHIAEFRDSNATGVAGAAAVESGALRFMQVSDSHLGFQGPANMTECVFTVPGEHDSMGDAGRAYRQTFGKGTLGKPHRLAGNTTAGHTHGGENSAPGATVARRTRIRQQGRTRLIGD